MKTLYKQLVSLAMVAVLAFAGSSIAFAAEPTISDEVKLYSSSDSDDSGIMPLSVTTIASGNSQDSTGSTVYRGYFTITSPKYVTMSVGTYTSCKVEVNGVQKHQAKSDYPTTGKVVTGSIDKEPLSAGTYFYEVTFGSRSAAWAFTLMLTDSYHAEY